MIEKDSYVRFGKNITSFQKYIRCNSKKLPICFNFDISWQCWLWDCFVSKRPGGSVTSIGSTSNSWLIVVDQLTLVVCSHASCCRWRNTRHVRGKCRNLALPFVNCFLGSSLSLDNGSKEAWRILSRNIKLRRGSGFQLNAYYSAILRKLLRSRGFVWELHALMVLYGIRL